MLPPSTSYHRRVSYGGGGDTKYGPSIFQYFFLILQFLLRFSNFPMFLKVFHSASPADQAPAQPKTPQNIGKLENLNKNWKILENIGKKWKIEGFPIFLMKDIGKTICF